MSLRYPLLQANGHSVLFFYKPVIFVTVPNLYGVDPGLGAAHALHGGDGGSVELTERQQARVDRVMAEGGGEGKHWGESDSCATTG